MLMQFLDIQKQALNFQLDMLLTRGLSRLCRNLGTCIDGFYYEVQEKFSPYLKETREVGNLKTIKTLVCIQTLHK